MRARIINGVAVDVLADGAVPAHWAGEFEAVPDQVRPQWVRLPLIEGGVIVPGAHWATPGSYVFEASAGVFEYRAHAPAGPVATVTTRHITKLAFRNRFTQPEKVGIEIAALDAPGAAMPARAQAAALRASQGDVQAATFVDLDRADTRAGVQALESAGLLAAGRALQILDAPVQPHEAHSGG